jgi:hypothetical protein
MTARTLAALGADRLYLSIDFFHRHRLDAYFGRAIRNRKERVAAGSRL